MPHVDIYDRMKVELPAGALGGMKIDHFEVVYPDSWTIEHEKRKDVMSPLQLARLQMRGRAPKEGWYTRLSENGSIWMSDTTSERLDHAEPVLYMSTAKPESVLINGLGIGMVLSAALSFFCVERVDVVEKDKRVIDLVGPHYLKDKRVTIHHADAVEQVDRWPADARWDVVWTDIWPDINADNLPEMQMFREKYGPRCDFYGNWSEDIVKAEVWRYKDSDPSYLKYLTAEEIDQFTAEDEEEAEQYEDYADTY